MQPPNISDFYQNDYKEKKNFVNDQKKEFIEEEKQKNFISIEKNQINGKQKISGLPPLPR